MEKKNPNKKPLNSFAKYSGLAIQMGVTIYLGSLLGTWVEGKYPTEGQVFEKGIALLAVFLAIFSVIRQVIKGQEND